MSDVDGPEEVFGGRSERSCDQADGAESLASEGKVAAQRERSRLRWAEAPVAAWAARSAIGLLVFAMVAVAFLSGRGWRDQEQSADGRNGDATIVNGERSVGGAASVASADRDRIEIPGSPQAEPEVSSGASAAVSGKAGEDLLVTGAGSRSGRQREASEQVAADESFADAAEPPSYVAQADTAATGGRDEAARGMLGAAEPSAETAAGNITSQSMLDLPVMPSLDETGGVVSYRDASGKPEEAGEDLPIGMTDRLRPGNDLRYTETPHPIGNFLEILEAWEASERQ